MIIKIFGLVLFFSLCLSKKDFMPNLPMLDIHVASWGLTGGWISNAYILQTKKACSNMKNLLGNSWFSLLKDFNIPVDKCPIPVGTYITSGFDMKTFEDHNNFPKVFFYGKYKFTIGFKNVENIIVGCCNAELNVIRPWETAI